MHVPFLFQILNNVGFPISCLEVPWVDKSPLPAYFRAFSFVSVGEAKTTEAYHDIFWVLQCQFRDLAVHRCGRAWPGYTGSRLDRPIWPSRRSQGKGPSNTIKRVLCTFFVKRDRGYFFFLVKRDFSFYLFVIRDCSSQSCFVINRDITTCHFESCRKANEPIPYYRDTWMKIWLNSWTLLVAWTDCL